MSVVTTSYILLLGKGIRSKEEQLSVAEDNLMLLGTIFPAPTSTLAFPLSSV
jgi:hypothetical protein